MFDFISALQVIPLQSQTSQINLSFVSYCTSQIHLNASSENPTHCTSSTYKPHSHSAVQHISICMQKIVVLHLNELVSSPVPLHSEWLDK